jgi:hypothetical protein
VSLGPHRFSRWQWCATAIQANWISRRLHLDIAPAVLDHYAQYLRLEEQVNRGSIETPEIGRRRVIPTVSPDTELVPPDSRGHSSAQIGRHRKPEFAGGLEEGRRDRRTIRYVGKREHVQRSVAAPPLASPAQELAKAELRT